MPIDIKQLQEKADKLFSELTTEQMVEWFKRKQNQYKIETSKDLGHYLEEIQVQKIDEETAAINNNPGLIGWYGVCTREGIVAFFGKETDALSFRLNYINRILNPIQ